MFTRRKSRVDNALVLATVNMTLTSTPEKFLAQQESKYFRAVQQGRLEDVRRILEDLEIANIPLLQGKVVVNHLIQKGSGNTGAHVAATLGHLHILRYLVQEKGANLEQINLDGKTVLHDAAQFSHTDAVVYLLSRGSNVNALKKADWTPLMLACTKQNVEVVETLLEHKADLYFVNKDGWNACHIAAREGNSRIVELLLNAAPDRKKLSQWQSRNGRKPLHTAVMHGHMDVAKLLVAESTTEEANAPDHCGTTPLMEAIRFGFLQLVELLVQEAGGDVRTSNSQGLNGLHIAAEAGQCESIKILLDKFRMKVNEKAQPSGMTPLHWAAKEGQYDAAKTLLILGADIKASDASGRTPLELAVAFKHLFFEDLFL